MKSAWDEAPKLMSPWYFHNTAGGDSNDSNSQYGNDCDADNDDTKSGRATLAVIVVFLMLKMVFNMVFNMVVTNLSNFFTSSRDIPSAALVWCRLWDGR